MKNVIKLFGLAMVMAIVFGFTACPVPEAGGGDPPAPKNLVWKALAFSTLYPMYDVAYGNGKYVAVGTGIANSTDGVTWTGLYNLDDLTDPRYTHILTEFYAVAFGSGRFVAVGRVESGSNGKMVTSTDGTTWTEVTAANSKFVNSDPDDPYSIFTIAYGNGRFVASDQYKIATSTNGTTWEALIGSNYQIIKIIYANNKFVALGCDLATSKSTILTSTNGTVWIPVTSDTIAVYDPFNGIAYGNGKFVAAKYDTGILVASDASSTWTAVPVSAIPYPKSSTHLQDIAFGNGTFVAVGSSGMLATSTDGTTWKAASPNPFADTDYCDGIIFVNGRFYIWGHYSSGSDSKMVVGTFE